MHIKKLEICGFKSFVDKTVVHFDHDVIGIVGPNGCGKSNIVDAIRWCMGEQSAKHLRGRSMEDVIFNGSESRAQHGLAEVTLTFDNADAGTDLPEEYRAYPEIAVTRRLFRDGTSEYLLNKTPVRLRDVTDLFLGTGVGTKAYSIVEQGRIGQIVSSRPQDRRAYIEEAAGITKYRLRRKQAERKMDQTRQNLLRITDIVSEIDRTRSSLKRQAAKAERYIRYREELEDLFLHDASHRLLGMLVTQKVHAAEVQRLQHAADTASARLSSEEGGLSKSRGEASSIESQYESANQRAVSANQNLAELKSSFDRTYDRVTNLKERLELLAVEEREVSAKARVLEQEKGELARRESELAEQERLQSGDTGEEDGRLAELRTREAALRQALQAVTDKATALQAELGGLQGRKEAQRLRLEDTVAALDRIANELSLDDTDANRLTEELEQLSIALADAKGEFQAAKDGAREAEAHLQQLQPELDSIGRERRALEEQFTHKQSRLTVLQDLHRRLEGVSAGTRALLSAADPSVLGILADRVQVSEEYTDALVGLLGDQLQCVIVDDPKRGLDLLAQLRDQRGGRATIAPRQAAYVAGSRSTAARHELAQGLLVDQVQFDVADEALVRALVGDAVVVATAADALQVNAAYPGSTIVALDGTVVRGSGLVSGGSGDSVAAGIVEQKREMVELGADLTRLESERAQAHDRAEKLEAARKMCLSAVEEQRTALHASELERLRLDKDHAERTAQVTRAIERKQRLLKQQQELEQRVSECERERDAAVARTEELQSTQETLEQQLAAAQAELSSATQLSSEQASRVVERKLRLTQIREQLDATRSAATRVVASWEEATQRLSRLDDDRTEAARALGESSAQLILTRERQLAAEAEQQAAELGRESIRHALEAVRESLAGREGELRELRVELAELDEARQEHQLALQKIELEREHLLGNVSERFRGLDLATVVGDYHLRPAPDGEHRRRIDELTKLIDRMGPVNLDAKEESDDAERRFTELNSQKEDIDQALSELERAIRHMDRESRKRFREAYDAINTLFKTTFTRLFRGGRAELKLTEPDNILETGVDIVAQPPGKKLGNIELMSGGEKALTATALIFAIFQHRPSPFCVLDEVDAPLDEANVSRYNDAIRAMTSQSQFIIITHIKKTMQSVDVLYGVTMGEPGVSRLVSVKVNDQAKARSERSSSVLETPASAQVVA